MSRLCTSSSVVTRCRPRLLRARRANHAQAMSPEAEAGWSRGKSDGEGVQGLARDPSRSQISGARRRTMHAPSLERSTRGGGLAWYSCSIPRCRERKFARGGAENRKKLHFAYVILRISAVVKESVANPPRGPRRMAELGGPSARPRGPNSKIGSLENLINLINSAPAP